MGPEEPQLGPARKLHRFATAIESYETEDAYRAIWRFWPATSSDLQARFRFSPKWGGDDALAPLSPGQGLENFIATDGHR
jgi:hypothetical protein